MRPDQVREGQRVRLLETDECPEEFATMLSERSENDVVLVQVDVPDDEYDDGLREVSLEEVEPCDEE